MTLKVLTGALNFKVTQPKFAFHQFPKLWHFNQKVVIGDNLLEISNPI